MTPSQAQALKPELNQAQLAGLNQACGRIAPTWPLDELIAVNPWWEMRDQPIQAVSAKLSALTQAQCVMPKSYFQSVWMETLHPHHLRQACAEMGHDFTVENLERFLLEDDEHTHWHNISDFVDSGRDRQHKMAWRDEITHQISQFCADFFRHKPSQGAYADTYGDLYREWLATTRQDKGIEILMAEHGLTEQFLDLPETADALMAEALAGLGVTDAQVADYAHALLLDINGWASWVAYLRWQDQLDQVDNGLMRDLLAIRMAWEWVLWRHQQRRDPAVFHELKVLWRHQMHILPDLIDTHYHAQTKSWIWQRALELTYQANLHQQLTHATLGSKATTATDNDSTPLLQAAFCIDVRSEVIRRALEAQDARIETLGFAGFFGLPIAYQPAGTDLSRPQLPGLLKSGIQVSPVRSPAEQSKTRQMLNQKARWLEWGQSPPAAFSMVEATGLLYAFKLLRNSLFPAPPAHPVNHLPASDTFALTQDHAPIDWTQKVDLAAGILRAMGLDQGMAQTVLLVGHGSSSCNNPHAAGLDCGACGGQTGEINVRVLAFLLNDPEVRSGLKERAQITVPTNTRFVAAMHNTTTDAFTCFGMDHDRDLIEPWLQRASQLARQERAQRLGLSHLPQAQMHQAIEARARDWSQVRPEWGLSNNAAFIVAPRARTKGLDLSGRAFLHDYDWRQDTDRSLLTLIMTAPMVVTNWINLQYYASVCDNHIYGSGNKVLHNVVDGCIGVFEGNGGDLRIGLPMQSLHDGEKWMHEPLRLSVYIDAPREAIAAVAADNASVRQLIDHEWLFCFRWGDAGEIERFYQGAWLPVEWGV